MGRTQTRILSKCIYLKLLDLVLLFEILNFLKFFLFEKNINSESAPGVSIKEINADPELFILLVKKIP